MPAQISGDSPWLVLKFGGTSVATARNWAIIHDLLRERLAAGYRPVVVHSAVAGISNRIQDALPASLDGRLGGRLTAIEGATWNWPGTSAWMARRCSAVICRSWSNCWRACT